MISLNFVKRTISTIILIPLIIILITSTSSVFNFFILIFLMISIYEWNNMTKNLLIKFYGIIFLIFSFYTSLKLKDYMNYEYFYLLFGVAISMATDLGGYIFGKILKGPKLIKFSPNKTFSGAIGAIILSIIISLVFVRYDYYFGYTILYDLNFYLIVILISFISQVGDIIISFFKRIAKINDTGSIIPGHGGLLDRIDGMIFVIPFIYLMLKLNVFNFLQ